MIIEVKDGGSLFIEGIYRGRCIRWEFDRASEPVPMTTDEGIDGHQEFRPGRWVHFSMTYVTDEEES